MFFKDKIYIYTLLDLMKKNQYLDNLIENVYTNCKVSQEERNDLIKYRDIITNILKYDLNDITIVKQGSFATFTQIITSDDFDIDIGVKLNCNIAEHKIISIKHKIYNILSNSDEIQQYFSEIELGTCCIKLYPRYDLCRNRNVMFEISIYKETNDGLFFAYDNKWKLDNKERQMKYLKNRLAENDGKREIVMFLKYFVSLNNKWKKYFKSIIILEFVIKYFPDNATLSISEKLLKTLCDFYVKINNRFELLVSANNSNRENLLKNDFREFNKNEFINYLYDLIFNIYLIVHYETVCYCCFANWIPLYKLFPLGNFSNYSEEQNLKYLLCNDCQSVIQFIIINELNTYSIHNIHSLLDS